MGGSGGSGGDSCGVGLQRVPNAAHLPMSALLLATPVQVVVTGAGGRTGALGEGRRAGDAVHPNTGAAPAWLRCGIASTYPAHDQVFAA